MTTKSETAHFLAIRTENSGKQNFDFKSKCFFSFHSRTSQLSLLLIFNLETHGEKHMFFLVNLCPIYNTGFLTTPYHSPGVTAHEEK